MSDWKVVCLGMAWWKEMGGANRQRQTAVQLHYDSQHSCTVLSDEIGGRARERGKERGRDGPLVSQP